MHSKIPLLALLLLLIVFLTAYSSAQPAPRTLDKILGYNFGPMRSSFPSVQHPYNHLQDFKDLGGSFARIVFYPSIDLVPNLATPEDPNDFIEDELSGIGFYETKFATTVEIAMKPSSDWDLEYYKREEVLNKINAAGLKPIAIITPHTDAIKRLQFDDGRIVEGVYNKQVWEDYVKAVITEYKNDIKYWEVENEPDLPDVHGGSIEYFNTTYREVLESAFRIIKQECSDCIVINGGLVSADAGIETDFFKWLRDNGVPTDALSLHRGGSLSECPEPAKPESMSVFYNGKRMDESINDSFGAFVSIVNPPPLKKGVWLTEMPGVYATQSPPGSQAGEWCFISEGQQADYIARGILLAFSRPEVELVSLQWIINDLDFTVLGTSDSLAFHSGIIKTDGTFKSAYYALQGLVNEVGDFELVECAAGQTLCASGNNFVMKFKKGTEAKWVAWNSEGASTVSINTGIPNQEVGSFNIVTGSSVNEFSNPSNITIDETPRVIIPVSTSTPSFKFAVLADSRSNESITGVNTLTLTELSSAILSREPSLVFVFFPGDLTNLKGNAGMESEFINNWENSMGGLFEKTFPQIGNHDFDSSVGINYWQNAFQLPNSSTQVQNFQFFPGFEDLAYSFKHGNSLFVSLSSDFPAEHVVSSEQIIWLQNILNDSTAQHKFVFLHEPPYPANSHIGSSLNSATVNALMPVLDAGEVDVIFAGHEHNYSRTTINNLVFLESTRTITQVISGGAGAPLHSCSLSPPIGVEKCESAFNFVIVEVDGSTATLKAFRQDGSLIETINLFLAPPVTPGVEICSNGSDDDSDALIDCLDSDCFGNSYCHYQSGCTLSPCTCLSGYNNCNASWVDGCETAGSCPVIPLPSGLKVSVAVDKQSFVSSELVNASAVVSGSGSVSSVEFQLINFNGGIVLTQTAIGSFPNYSAAFNLASLQGLTAGSFKVKVIVSEGMLGEVVGFSDYFFINFAGQAIAIPEFPVFFAPLVALIALLVMFKSRKREF